MNFRGKSPRPPSSVDPTRIDPRTKISKRYFIEKLQISDKSIITDLKQEYSSCISISEDRNQIRAFGLHLSRHILRSQNDSRTQKMIEKFSLKSTMCELTLDSVEFLQNLNYLDAVVLCEKMICRAVQFSYLFSNLHPFKLNIDMETDFKTIQILGKIFGVTLVVVSEEQDGTCRRMIFNGGIDDNLPCFHYFSRLNARNMKKIVALFTFRDDFLDGYQGDRVELKIKRSIILDENAEDTKIQKSKSIKNQSQDYFIALNKIQNTILTSYLTKITEGLPPSIEENLTEDLLILKSLKSQQDINPSDFNSNNFEVLNFSFESFNTTCHKCNISITSSKNEIFSREGCFFHFECVLSMYKEWMETSIDYSLQIEDYELKCPRCKNRSISILSFLKHEENKENLRIFLLIFTKKMTCSNCFVTFYINPETFNLNNPICFNCAIKNSPETIVICGECKNQTLAVNLRYRATTKEFKCKICWINQAAIFINNKKLEDFNDVLGNILGNGSIIDCENCGSKYFKNAGNFFCEYGCYPILMSTCFNCVGEGKCEACAGNIKQDFFKKWE